jgi:hypothetical protein
MLGYLSKIFVLIKGWLCFLFKSAVVVESILQKTWLVKSGTLMLKHWHITFNPVKEHFRYRHCPLEDNISNIFMKPLDKINFTKFREELGICSNVLLDQRGEC